MKCDILATGPSPSERVVGINTTDGSEEVVLHTSALIGHDTFGVGGHDKFEVGVLGYENGRALIELPRESASGRWRVWVPKASLLTV